MSKKRCRSDDVSNSEGVVEVKTLPLELQLWSKQYIGADFDRSESVKIFPRAVADPATGTITFSLDPIADCVYDLASFRLVAQTKIVGPGGRSLEKIVDEHNVPAYEDVSTVCAPLASAFRSVELRINGVTVGFVHSHSAVASYISDATSYSPNDRNMTIGPLSLAIPDDGDFAANSIRNLEKFNLGLMKRCTEYHESREVTLSIPISHDLLQSSFAYLMPGLGMQIVLHRQAPRFNLMAPQEDIPYEFHIKSPYLTARRLKLGERVRSQLAASLSRAPAIYNYCSILPYTYEIPAKTTLARIDLPWARSPSRALLVLTDAAGASTGSFTKNPYNFESGNVREVQFKLNNASYGEVIRSDFTRKNYREVYLSFLNSLGRVGPQTQHCSFNYEAFNSGFCVWGVSLKADEESHMDSNSLEGRLSVEIRFDTQNLPDRPFLAQIFCEYPSFLSVDSDMTVRDVQIF